MQKRLPSLPDLRIVIFLSFTGSIFAANLYIMRKIPALCIGLILIAACNGVTEGGTTGGNTETVATPLISYSIVQVLPHDTSYYTQGLELYNGKLYESGGNYGRSKFGFTTPGATKHEKETKVPEKYFAEGLTVFNNQVYLLTWRENTIFIHDAATLQKIKEVNWPFEGWGITHNNKELIISTGSSNLYFVDPVTFKIIRTVGVSDQYGPVGNLNELEYVNGVIYANQYTTNYILQINPETGKVTGKLDLGNVLEKSGQAYDPAKVDVLNGIAYDSTSQSLYVTGKNWPALFQIRLN